MSWKKQFDFLQNKVPHVVKENNFPFWCWQWASPVYAGAVFTLKKHDIAPGEQENTPEESLQARVMHVMCVKSPLCFNHRLHEILTRLVPASFAGISYQAFEGNLPLEWKFERCFHPFTAFLNDCLSEPLNACKDGKSFQVHQEGKCGIPKTCIYYLANRGHQK